MADDKKHTVIVGAVDDDHNDVCLRSGSGDEGDDDAYLPLRSVFPISFDCLDSHNVGTEVEMHIESQRCDVGLDRDKSHEGSSHVVGSDSTTKQRRQQQTRLPKKKRNKIPTTLAPNLPSTISQNSYIHGAPVVRSGLGHGSCTSDSVECLEVF